MVLHIYFKIISIRVLVFFHALSMLILGIYNFILMLHLGYISNNSYNNDHYYY